MKKENKIPFWKTTARTLKLCSGIADQWRVMLSYAFVLSIICLVFRRWSYGCMTNTPMFWCGNDRFVATTGKIFEYVSYFVLTIFVIFAYIHDYYQTAFCQQKFVFSDVFKMTKAKLKSVSFIFALLLMFVIMGGLAYYLIKKPANPNFMIEFLYFLLVFCSFLVPIIMVRLAAFISMFLQNGQLPDLKKLYKDTDGHSYTPISLFFLWSMICILFLKESGRYLKYFGAKSENLASTFLLEMVGYVVILMCYGIILSVFRAQHEILQENNVSRETEAPEEKSGKDVTHAKIQKKEHKNKVKKAANKSTQKVKKQKTVKKKTNTN